MTRHTGGLNDVRFAGTTVAETDDRSTKLRGWKKRGRQGGSTLLEVGRGGRQLFRAYLLVHGWCSTTTPGKRWDDRRWTDDRRHRHVGRMKVKLKLPEQELLRQLHVGL